VTILKMINTYMNIPVKYKNTVIGYTPDEGNTIVFDESETAKYVKSKILNKGIISVSSRSTGEVDHHGKIFNQQINELNIF